MSRHKSKKPASDREKQELISRILLETTVESDEVVAKRHNISRRTIQRYREQLRNVASDTGLAQVVREKRAQMDDSWAAKVDDVTRAGIEFILRAAREGDTQNPDMVHAIAGAMKIVTEIWATRKILDVRLTITHQPD